VTSYEPEPVNFILVFPHTFLRLSINQVFFARRPLHPNMRGRGAKNTAGFYTRLAAQTPIRAHNNAAHQT
jgi:hypothetical protein